jgi:multiple sugar transport system permease protein
VLAQLTVNPLCAYALSRYKLKQTYNILMFFIATMAFPPMANGYYIFLMKGFFDSLPKELYEAAAIEGASEFHMFFKITLPLVKPIMAVKALGAFTAAYGGFMWAFVICQDPRMWTIMVYIYQFQQGNPYHLVMTALVLSSLPLLFMFIFCQKIIMRGIVIPVMK